MTEHLSHGCIFDVHGPIGYVTDLEGNVDLWERFLESLVRELPVVAAGVINWVNSEGWMS